MEDQEITDPLYLKGFNQGYLIAQHEPILAEQLQKVQGTQLYLEGFKDGVHEFIKEEAKLWRPEWLSRDAPVNPTEDIKDHKRGLDYERE